MKLDYVSDNVIPPVRCRLTLLVHDFAVVLALLLHIRRRVFCRNGIASGKEDTASKRSRPVVGWGLLSFLVFYLSLCFLHVSYLCTSVWGQVNTTSLGRMHMLAGRLYDIVHEEPESSNGGSRMTSENGRTHGTSSSQISNLGPGESQWICPC